MPAKNPDEMVIVWSAAFNRADVDALVALYEPRAVLVRASGDVLAGHDAIRAAFTSIVAGKPRIEARTRKVVRAGELALTFGEWRLRTSDPVAGPREISGRSAEVLRRQADGTWRHVIDDPNAG